MRKIILLFLVVIYLNSCNNVQSTLQKVENEIEYAEKNKKDMSASDWSALEVIMQELERDLFENRENYTENQINEAGKLQGRYFALILKKGVYDLEETINDFGNQLNGFIEGLESDTIININENE